MKELAAFTPKDLRTAERVAKVLSDSGNTITDLRRFNAEVTEQKAQTQRVRSRRDGKPAQKQYDFLLKGGDTELVELFCGCGSPMVIEALCPARVEKNKCIRIAICTECGNEVKIR